MNLSPEDYEDFVEEAFSNEEVDYKEITVEDAHNLIFGAIDYAESLGFEPMDKDWAITKHFLNEDYITDEIDDIEFGKDGKPFYFAGPYDRVKYNLAILNKSVGEGNYDFMIRPDFM